MSTNQINRKAAAKAYLGHANDIARLMDVLEMEIKAHAERAAVDTHYGDVGDIFEVRRILIQAVGQISCKEPAEVEAFLSDAEVVQ